MDLERVLDSAGALLALRPAATMDDIAEAVGVSRATLFRRFPSRAGLVEELMRRAVKLFVGAVEAARPEEGLAVDALRRVLHGLVALAPRYGLLALQPLSDVVEESLQAESEAAEQRLRALVVRGQSVGAFRVDLPADWVLLTITWLIVGAADGLRLGRVAAADVERLVSETVLGAVER